MAFGSPLVLHAAVDAERPQKLQTATVEEIFERSEEVAASAPLPGMSIGLVMEDRLVRERGFGFANLASHEPATSRTLYQIGSITKSFTSTLLGILADEKVLALDDTMSEHLPRELALPRFSLKAPMGYGLGWGSDELETGHIVFHDGGCDGYTAYIGFSPAGSVGVIILANVGSRTAARPVRELGHWILGRLMQSGGN